MAAQLGVRRTASRLRLSAGVPLLPAASMPFTSLSLENSQTKIPRQSSTMTGKLYSPIKNTVQASASQGSEIALGHALVSTFPANQLIVSPPFRGSNPYPCGSLTYRIFICIIIIIVC